MEYSTNMRSRDIETEKKIIEIIKKKSQTAEAIMKELKLPTSSCYKYLNRLESEGKIFSQLQEKGKIYTAIKSEHEIDEELLEQLLEYLTGKNKQQRLQASEDIRKHCMNKLTPSSYTKRIIGIIKEEKDSLVLYKLLQALDMILLGARNRNNNKIINEIRINGEELLKVVENKTYTYEPKRIAIMLLGDLQYKEAVPRLLKVVRLVTDNEYKKIGGEIEYAIGKIALIDMRNVRSQLYDLLGVVKEKVRERLRNILKRPEIQP